MKPKDKKNQYYNYYKYSGIAMQMAVIIIIGVFGGYFRHEVVIGVWVFKSRPIVQQDNAVSIQFLFQHGQGCDLALPRELLGLSDLILLFTK